MRTNFDKLTSGKKKKMEPEAVSTVTIIVGDSYVDWQIEILKFLKNAGITKANQKEKNANGSIKTLIGESDKKKLTDAFEFASLILEDHSQVGESAFSTELSFDQSEVLKKTQSALLRDLKHIKNFVVSLPPDIDHQPERGRTARKRPNQAAFCSGSTRFSAYRVRVIIIMLPTSGLISQLVAESRQLKDLVDIPDHATTMISASCRNFKVLPPISLLVV